ncbi:MAG TPA: M23 family metallopeptidase [Acidimicrobiales bacterium]|nr:M23 family metallopeptidase [Acidimicrobiales bacterium]
MARLGAGIIVLAAAITLSVSGGAGSAQAQITIPTLLPTTTTTAPAPAPATPPTTGSLLANLLKPPTTTTIPTTAAPAPTTAAPAPRTPIPGNEGREGEGVPADAGPFPAELAAKMNSVRRSGPRSSDQLVDSLKALTDLGVPLDEAMRVGMGRFPVAGRTHFIDDWWFPRFGPGWRLHEGTDMFAERNTPLRAPTNGTVHLSDGGLGGISVYVTQSDGTYFYLTHLDHRAPGLKEGQQVSTGDIVGFVGTTGNAAGGAPHLHFEVHPAIRIVTVGKGRKAVTKAVSAPVRPGTVLPAIDPKPLLDFYLQEALDRLPAIVASYQARQPVAAPPVATGAVPHSVVLASHFSSGGLIAADAPLARTPLLGLAFLLIVMVVVLTPVLAPRRRPFLAVAVGRPAAGTRDRRRRSLRPRRRAKATASPPTILLPGAVSANGQVASNGHGGINGTSGSRLRRGRRKGDAGKDAPAGELAGTAAGPPTT